ncbi:hypothetical protein CROQUDRAFT_651101 [Cronartium quercuum f. sp. fusiforme G11]|uniref:Uncharacterized protein n=1 Tax=Cronartium quercuum f. sp. fusiforme G11 TaxID=708437 RepID=A0A9P6NSR6_9BASI|nr:hypothetical protein CROQUDRAFT_651101 [Cronartium quercuum f. sp. fusiforme G11]
MMGFGTRDRPTDPASVSLSRPVLTIINPPTHRANIQSDHHFFLPDAAAKMPVVDAQFNLIQCHHHHQHFQAQMLQILHLHLVYYIINLKMTIVKQPKNDASYTDNGNEETYLCPLTPISH